MTTIRRMTLATALLGALALAPLEAAADRIITRSGEVFVGEPRVDGDILVIRRPDGSEVRIPRDQVERIELDDGRGATTPPARPAPRTAPPPAPPRPPPAPRAAPSYPRYVPPPPPPRPDPRLGRRMLEHTGFRSGLGVKVGFQRGLAAGAEWQQRVARFVGLGVGAQGGLAFNEDVTCPTWGATGRLYLGNEHRFVGEAGVGLNRIDPYLNLGRTGREPTCGRAEVNVGPEFSAGYQFVSRQGFLFEALGGLTLITNDALADAHASVAPLFQISAGFVFR